MLKPNHLQSLIATTRTRINEMHKGVEAVNDVLPIMKSMNTILNGVFDEQLEEGYKLRAALRRDIAKAVELQKALKLELKEAYKAQVKPVKNTTGIYNIDKDGQPTKNGYYTVWYAGLDPVAYPSAGSKLYFSDGVWYFSDEIYFDNTTAFGNADTAGEHYKFVG